MRLCNLMNCCIGRGWLTKTRSIQGGQMGQVIVT